MLKIKDNVDLKELEKFGFEKYFYGKEEYLYKKLKPKLFYNEILEITYKKSISYGIEYKKILSKLFKNKKINKLKIQNDLFKDLIRAGLVEKVE